MSRTKSSSVFPLLRHGGVEVAEVGIEHVTTCSPNTWSDTMAWTWVRRLAGAVWVALPSQFLSLACGTRVAVTNGTGVLSLLVRNGDALAMRPGLLDDWDTTRRAFEDLSYHNRIGVTARADRIDDLVASLTGRG